MNITLIADGRLSPRTVEALRRHGILNERVEEDDTRLNEATVAELRLIKGVGVKTIAMITDARRQEAKTRALDDANTHGTGATFTPDDSPEDVRHVPLEDMHPGVLATDEEVRRGTNTTRPIMPGDLVDVRDSGIDEMPDGTYEVGEKFITRKPEIEESVVVYQNGEAVATFAPPEHKLGTRAAVTFLQARHMEWLEETAKLHNDTVDRIIEQCIRRVYSEDAYKAGGTTVKREDFEV